MEGKQTRIAAAGTQMSYPHEHHSSVTRPVGHSWRVWMGQFSKAPKVIPFGERSAYVEALEKASVGEDIGPFASFLAGLYEKNWPANHCRKFRKLFPNHCRSCRQRCATRNAQQHQETGGDQVTEYLVVYEQSQNGWGAYAPDLPGLGVR